MDASAIEQMGSTEDDGSHVSRDREHEHPSEDEGHDFGDDEGMIHAQLLSASNMEFECSSVYDIFRWLVRSTPALFYTALVSPCLLS